MGLNALIVSGTVFKKNDMALVKDKKVQRFILSVDEGYNNRKVLLSCTAWGETATKFNEIVSQGMEVLLRGTLKANVYEAKGVKYNTVDIMVSEFYVPNIQTSKPKAPQVDNVNYPSNTSYQPKYQNPQDTGESIEFGDDDLPF